jgi:hypothetical protein
MGVGVWACIVGVEIRGWVGGVVLVPVEHLLAGWLGGGVSI